MGSATRTAGGWFGGAALVAGALLAWTGTGLHPHAWATWMAAVPVLAFAARAKPGPAIIVAVGAWGVGGLNLWGYLSDIVQAPLAMRLVVVLLPALLFGMSVWLWRLQIVRGAVWRAVWVLPCFWVSTEFLLVRVSLHGTFGSLAYTQLDFLPVVQLAALAGIHGVSFALLLFASAVGVMAAPAVPGQKKVRLAMAVGLVLGTVLLWGALRLCPREEKTAALTIGLVASSDKERIFPRDSSTAREVLAAYAEAVGDLAKAGAGVVVLPEKIAWLTEADAQWARAAMRAVALQSRVNIVAGWARRDGARVWNEAAFFSVDGNELNYKKRHLLPGLEAEFTVGDAHVTTLQSGRVWGLAVCKDMDFPEIARAYGQSETALLLVPAWDFQVDGWLHSRMAVMRGVEGGFMIARAAKQGLLTVSDPFGRVVAEAVAGGPERSTLVTTVRPRSVSTFYRRWGDWFAWVCVMGTATIIVVGTQRRRGA